MNNTNVTAYTDTELADLLAELTQGDYFPHNGFAAVGEIRRGCDRMAGYKTHYTDRELRAVAARHFIFDGYDD